MTNLAEGQLRGTLEEAAAKLASGEHVDWPQLVTEALGMSVRYIPGVQAALAQGRWRSAKDPKAYLQKAARRETAKAEQAGKPKETLRIPRNLGYEDGRMVSQQEYIDNLCYDEGPMKKGGVWRARNPFQEVLCTDEEGRVVPTVNGRPIPEDLLMLEDDEPDAKLIVNWRKVWERAGLDAQQTDILLLRRLGFTRDIILQQVARNDKERRGMQAAWRRLERHKDRVLAVLAGEPQKIKLPKTSPNPGLRVLRK